MTAIAKTFSVLNRIETYQSQMPATMSKIAAVLIDDPKAPLRFSITELAERAGTSAASVTRFCRMIGYGGYSQQLICRVNMFRLRLRAANAECIVFRFFQP